MSGVPPIRRRADDLDPAESLRAGLAQVVGDLRGVAGLVYVQAGSPDGLHLVSSTGLSPDHARSLRYLTNNEICPHGRTVFEGAQGARAWLPAPAAADGAADGIWPAVGVAVVPLPGTAEPDGPKGALAVLLQGARQPGAEQWALLESAAARAAVDVRRAFTATTPLSQTRRAAGSTTPEALQAVGVGCWECTPATNRLVLDEQALAVLGIDDDCFDGRLETWTRLIHVDDRSTLASEGARAIRTGSLFIHEHRLCRPDGACRWVRVRGRVKPGAPEEPVTFVGTLCDVTESRSARERISHAMRHMSDGFLVVDRGWRITFVNTAADAMLGAAKDIVGRVLWDLPATGRLPLPVGLREMCRRVADTATPADVDVKGPVDGRWYRLRLVPLSDGMAFFFTDVHDKRERKAAERAEALRAARTLELTAALAEAIGTQGVVDAVARHVLPMFGAAGLVMQVIEDDQVRIVGSAGYTQDFLDLVATIPLSATNATANVLRSRTPQFFSTPEEYLSRYPQSAYLGNLGDKEAWAFLPLIASDQPVGVCALAFARPRRFTREERTLMVALSGLIAQALERARLFDAEHLRAQELQRGLLPQELPMVPYCSTAVCYQPAGQGMDVGGDWYDLIPLSSHRIALVIGDVMGHGLAQAAAMGRLRTAVHTLAGLELAPDEVLEHLNEVVAGLGDDSYATMLYAVYDPVTGRCVFACAGHPPPAVVGPDGTVRFPDLPSDPPLGAADPPFETTEVTVPDGSLLVLYTDGLVESSRCDIDTGMSRLAQLLGEGGHLGDLDTLCEKEVAGLLPARQQTSDDAAVLLARVHRVPADAIAAWPLRAEPQAAGEARRLVGEQLERWGLSDLVTTTELLVSELVGNVARHAKGPVGLRLLRDSTLICEVSDGSLTTPRIRRASALDEGGRGLQLVAALSRRWGTRYTATGKCIWTEQAIGDRAGVSADTLLSALADGPFA